MQTTDSKVPISQAPGHVLLVSPRTFSYHMYISETLRAMGYQVTWWDDRPTNATWYKLALRLFPTITAQLSAQSFLARLRELDQRSITHVLVIKGEGISRSFAQKMRKTLASASMGLYLWDGAENVKGVSNILSAFDSVATFDLEDAKRFHWTFRPLFGRKISRPKDTRTEQKFDWCFVGTIHSDRHQVIHRLRQHEGQAANNFVFGYFQSPIVLFVRRLLDWTLWLAPKSSLSTQPMPPDEVAKRVGQSRAVLDIEHPRQRGLTMRTIETLLAGKKLVTTNKHILSSNIYHPSRVQIISRDEPKIDPEFLDQPFADIADPLKVYYSCEGWVGELLAIQDSAKESRDRCVS